jgi:hypothetical protein
MNALIRRLACPAAVLWLIAAAAAAQEVHPMFGGNLIDGYNFSQDVGPKGSVVYDPKKNEFRGKYVGLKMPAGRRAIFAWAHDTVNQKILYLGPIGWLKLGTSGKNKGTFRIKGPRRFKGGNFGSYEIIGFSSERTDSFDGKKVIWPPASPSGSQTLPGLKPAYYLFARLPGADTNLVYCGHGQDFAYAKDLDKQTCYD